MPNERLGGFDDTFTNIKGAKRRAWKYNGVVQFYQWHSEKGQCTDVDNKPLTKEEVHNLMCQPRYLPKANLPAQRGNPTISTNYPTTQPAQSYQPTERPSRTGRTVQSQTTDGGATYSENDRPALSLRQAAGSNPPANNKPDALSTNRPTQRHLGANPFPQLQYASPKLQYSPPKVPYASQQLQYTSLQAQVPMSGMEYGGNHPGAIFPRQDLEPVPTPTGTTYVSDPNATGPWPQPSSAVQARRPSIQQDLVPRGRINQLTITNGEAQRAESRSTRIRRNNSAIVDPMLLHPPQQRTLDPEYYVRPSSFFVRGRVFLMIWHESNTAETRKTESGTEISAPTFLGQSIHSTPRRMVVVKTVPGHSWCIPIARYGGRGCKKNGLPPSVVALHTVAYMEGTIVQPEEEEERRGMNKRPICIRPTTSQKLDRMSRMNFSKCYTVEHNIKVMDVGIVHPDWIHLLVLYFKSAMEGI